MKRQPAKSRNRLWLVPAIASALLFVAAGLQPVIAQTNTFPTSGNAGIGTTTPANPLDVSSNQDAVVRLIGLNNPSGGSSAQAALSFFEGATEKAKLAINGSGATGYVGGARAFQVWNFQNAPIVFGTNSVERVRIDGSGNVGIGLSPIYTLDVNGGVNGFRIKAASTQSNDTIATFENSSAIQMIVRANGNVGIGTTAPSNLLHLNSGSSPSSQLRLSANNAGSLSGLAYSADNIALGFDVDWNNGWIARHGTVASLYKIGSKLQMMGSVGNTVGSPIATWTPYTTLDLTTGNFGIGTTATTYGRLVVNKIIRIDDDSGSPTGSDTLNGAPNIYLGTTSGGNAFQFNGGGGLDLWQHNNAAWGRTVTFAKTGNVGIGTTSPGYKLDVAGQIRSSTGGFVFPDGTVQTTASSGTGGTQWANNAGGINYSSGNVGIGTSTPGNRFEVIESNSATASSIRVLSGSASAYAGYAIGRTGTEGYWGIAGGATHYSNAAVAGDVVLRSESNLILSNSSNSTLYLKSNGNVGIGMTTPTTKLEVADAITSSGSGAGLIFKPRNGSGQTWQWYNPSGADARLWNPAGGDVLTVQNAGNVGVGTGTPTEKLHVAGNGKFTGNLTVDGNIAAKYQDVAEWVRSAEQHAAGTVVVLDSTKSNEVIASTQAYDTRVAGVISAQPGIALGESGVDKVLVATTGRVKVKVDASRAPIHTGDLLVTSDIPGVAMKSQPVNLGGVQLHRPGTLIGKALEPLEKGSGEILVLLSLQ
jgi:hypothetical protein